MAMSSSDEQELLGDFERQLSSAWHKVIIKQQVTCNYACTCMAYLWFTLCMYGACMAVLAFGCICNVAQMRLFPVIKNLQILPSTYSLDLYFAKNAINNYMGASSE